MNYLITYFGPGDDRGCVEKKTRAGVFAGIIKAHNGQEGNRWQG